MIYSTFLDITLISIFVFWLDYEPLEGKNQVLFILFHFFALTQTQQFDYDQSIYLNPNFVS